jgi:hypothetical protein
MPWTFQVLLPVEEDGTSAVTTFPQLSEGDARRIQKAWNHRLDMVDRPGRASGGAGAAPVTEIVVEFHRVAGGSDRSRRAGGEAPGAAFKPRPAVGAKPGTVVDDTGLLKLAHHVRQLGDRRGQRGCVLAGGIVPGRSEFAIQLGGDTEIQDQVELPARDAKAGGSVDLSVWARKVRVELTQMPTKPGEFPGPNCRAGWKEHLYFGFIWR